LQTWNSQLATLGQTWADRCAFEHGQPQFSAAQVGYAKLGQNLYVSSDTTKGVADGVQAWFDEKNDYTYDTMFCQPGKACGHYTQV
jgi:pathogenesis-related protein 1